MYNQLACKRLNQGTVDHLPNDRAPNISLDAVHEG